MPERCPNCSTQLVGEYCHGCGQRRIDGRLTLRAFLDDVRRRVFRFDGLFAVTFSRMLREPGTLVVDYLEGRRRALIDPLHYFISSLFVQFVIAAFTRWVAPLISRESALGWLAQLGGVVAIKIFIIFWMASIWRLLFNPIRYNLASSTGPLWTFAELMSLGGGNAASLDDVRLSYAPPQGGKLLRELAASLTAQHSQVDGLRKTA